MATRTQTLVQLNDELITALDQKRAHTGQSRSYLIREALQRYLQRDVDEAEIDRQIVEAYTEYPQTEEEWGPWTDAATEILAEDDS